MGTTSIGFTVPIPPFARTRDIRALRSSPMPSVERTGRRCFIPPLSPPLSRLRLLLRDGERVLVRLRVRTGERERERRGERIGERER